MALSQPPRESPSQMPDAALLAEIGKRIARHRLGQNLTQAQLAKEAGMSKRTLNRIEAGESTQLINLIRVLRALKLLDNLDGIVPPPVASPVEQLRMQGKKRKRASPSAREPEEQEQGWSWDDAPHDSDGVGESS